MSDGKNSDSEILHDDVELSPKTEEQLSRYDQSAHPQQLVPLQPSLRSAVEAERRIVDRRHAERRFGRIESPHPTVQWQDEIQRGFNAATDDTLRVIHGALLHIMAEQRHLIEQGIAQKTQEAIAKLQEEVRQLRTEVASKSQLSAIEQVEYGARIG